MKLYRLCSRKELDYILENKNFDNIFRTFVKNPNTSTHNYLPDTRYIHLFREDFNVLYLRPCQGKYICVYDIPGEITKNCLGLGIYYDYIYFKRKTSCLEYAIDASKMQFAFLKKVYLVVHPLSFDYVPSVSEIYDKLICVYEAK